VDFAISDKIKALRGTLREFMKEEVYPLEPRLLRGESWTTLAPVLEEKRRLARQTGLWLGYLSESHGGAGLSLTEYAHMSEELGRSPLGHYLFNCQAPDVGNIEILIEFGTPEQQARWLEPLCAGTIRSCFTMTEPEFAGSNPVWLGTTARREGEEWVIRGHKWFSSSADGAALAICMAVTEPEAEPHRRASMILVPTDTPGFELVRNVPVWGHAGSGYFSHGEVSYHGARVPQANTLGPAGSGFLIAQHRLGPGRIHHCMRWLGICERALDILCKHAVSRELAPGVPLGSKQMVQQWISESRAEINGARLMVLHAAWRIEQEGAPAAREDISLIKFTVARTMQRVIDRAIQALGALGTTDETPLAWWYAHERPARIYDGADEVHIESVARRILRGYGMK
jgi:alkylation response protein AidB-like acyl-CoA dehydrogenase